MDLSALKRLAGIGENGKTEDNGGGFYGADGKWNEYLPEQMPNPRKMAAERKREEIKEGTWSIPDSKEKVQRLVDLMKNPIPANQASDLLYDLVGDDDLFDAIAEVEEKDGPGDDVRPVVKNHLEKMAHHFPSIEMVLYKLSGMGKAGMVEAEDEVESMAKRAMDDDDEVAAMASDDEDTWDKFEEGKNSEVEELDHQAAQARQNALNAGLETPKGKKWNAKYKDIMKKLHSGGYEHLDQRMEESYSYLRTPVKKRVDEAHPNQQMSIYNPDGETYRGSANKMPTLPDDPAIDNADPIDSIMNMSDDGRISDIIDKDHIDKLKSAIREVLLTLTPREERVIRSRFFHDKTLKEIGDEFSVSKDRIRQIEAKALRKMKHPSRSNKIQGFLS